MRAVVCAKSMTLTPPASAAAVSPLHRPCAARCAATRDDEHAVSVLTHGPWQHRTTHRSCRELSVKLCRHASYMAALLSIPGHTLSILCCSTASKCGWSHGGY